MAGFERMLLPEPSIDEITCHEARRSSVTREKPKFVVGKTVSGKKHLKGELTDREEKIGFAPNEKTQGRRLSSSVCQSDQRDVAERTEVSCSDHSVT